MISIPARLIGWDTTEILMAWQGAREGASAVRAKRARLAARYQPEVIDLLLVAEAPPVAPERYFYEPQVFEHDALFRYVARGVLGLEPQRAFKEEHLRQLREQGVFLIDLKPDPVDQTPLSEYVPDLVDRIRELEPARIVLIKATVYDTAFRSLREAGLPVVDERVPFPGSGQQRRFAAAFARALRASS